MCVCALCTGDVKIIFFNDQSFHKTNGKLYMLQQNKSKEIRNNNTFYILIIRLLFQLCLGVCVCLCFWVYECVYLCAKPRKLITCSISFFFICGWKPPICLMIYFAVYFSLCCFFEFNFFLKKNFVRFVDSTSFTHSFEKIRIFLFFFFSWFQTFICNGVNQWMELYIISNIEPYKNREIEEKRKIEKNTANNCVHLSDWNQVVSSTGVECFESTHTQTDRHSYICTISSIAISFSIFLLCMKYIEWNNMLVVVSFFLT